MAQQALMSAATRAGGPQFTEIKPVQTISQSKGAAANRGQSKRLKIPPAAVLFLLAPAVAELLSGSAPPSEFFSPFSFLMLVSLYGSGAIVARELKIRWKKGIGSLLLLGAAYCVLEEGLMVASFFNPNWPDLGALGIYGRWLGTNWVWTEMLILYHAVFSITIPIVLVELAYPERRDESWVGSTKLKGFVILLGGVTVFGLIAFSSMLEYWPSVQQYIFALSLILLFVFCSRKLPANWGLRGNKALPKPRRLWLLGVHGASAFILGFWLAPFLVPWPVVTMLWGPLLLFLYSRYLRRFDWTARCDLHKFALVSGALTFFILLTPLQELDRGRVDNTAGMTLVGLSVLLGLAWLGLRVRNKISIEV